jgi:hypothetical protein
MQFSHRISRIVEVILIVAILASSILVRTHKLKDDTINPDDPIWQSRILSFIEQLKRGDLMAFSQSAHPGITLLISGGLTYYLSGFAASDELNSFSQETLISNDENVKLLRYQGSMLGRLDVAVFTCLLLLTLYFFLRRIFEFKLALLAYAFLAIDPFYVAHGRVLQLDSLLSTFLLLSAVVFITYILEKKHYLLLLSGMFGALAFLTRSPAVFMIPYVFFIVVVGAVYEKYVMKKSLAEQLKFGVRDFFIWLLYFLGFVFVFNPALWVSPIKIFEFIFGRASMVGFREYNSFFFGRVTNVPNLIYYLVAVPFRMTPIALLSVPLWVAAIFERRTKFFDGGRRKAILFLAIFVFGYALEMSIPDKRGERYLLASIIALTLLSAVGIYWLWERLKIAGDGRWMRRLRITSTLVLLILASVCIAVVGLSDVLVRPHYLAYYNPLFGGGRTAYRTILVGWGEGYKEAADYFNSKPGAEDLNISTWYESCMIPFLKGKAYPIGEVTDKGQLDYVVLYINQIQRYRIREMIQKYFFNSKPEKIIWFNNIPYVFIYKKYYPLDFSDKKVMVLNFYDLNSDAWCTRNWGMPETLGRWGLGKYSIISIDLDEKYDYKFAIRSRALENVKEAQNLRVLLNGREIGNFSLSNYQDAIFKELEMKIPSEYVKNGPDEIRFEYRYSKKPSDFGESTDTRELALVFSTMRFEKIN